MNKDYNRLLSELQKRMNPEGYADRKLFGESVDREFLTLAGHKALEYVKRSMQGVGEEYTQRSLAAGSNVITHLENVLLRVTYEFQGSVMTNTHIRGNSDIDLLVICDRFYYSNNSTVLDKYNHASSNFELTEYQRTRLQNHINAGSYLGDSDGDLRSLRLQSESKMKDVYDKVVTSKPKCIEITNQSLHRDVDIVIASWHKTFEGIRDNNSKRNRIRIYDKDLNTVGRVESPFISIDRINSKNSRVNGRLKKMIRFLKTLKYDSGKVIDLNSFELNAICYNIDIRDYANKSFSDLVIVLANELALIVRDSFYRDQIMSVDGSENVFKGKQAKVHSLERLLGEITDILSDLKTNLIHSYVH